MGVVKYAETANGRAIGVDVADAPGVRVLVSPRSPDDQDAADDLSDRIAALPRLARDFESSCRTVRTLRSEVARLSGETNSPRAFGQAVVRETEHGHVWALSDRAKGWASFGFRFDSWADLARAWPSLRPCGAGADEHGPYVLMRCVGGWPEARVTAEEAL